MKTKFCNYLTKKHRTHGLVNHTIIINLYHKTSYFIVGLICRMHEIIQRGHVTLANKYSYA